MDDDLDTVQRDKIYVFWWTDIVSLWISQSQSSTRGVHRWEASLPEYPASQRLWCGRSLIQELMLIGQWLCQSNCQSSSPHHRGNHANRFRPALRTSMQFCNGIAFVFLGVCVRLWPSVSVDRVVLTVNPSRAASPIIWLRKLTLHCLKNHRSCFYRVQMEWLLNKDFLRLFSAGFICVLLQHDTNQTKTHVKG